MSNIYQENGFENREDYLQDLADSYGVPLEVVHVTAGLFGPSEDFDGLVTTIEDYSQGIY